MSEIYRHRGIRRYVYLGHPFYKPSENLSLITMIDEE